MAGSIKRQQNTTTNLDGGSTSSLSNSAGVACANILDCTSLLDETGVFVLNAGFGSAVTIGNAVALYLVPSEDGTNYGDVDTTSSPPTISPPAFAGVFVTVLNQTGAQKMLVTVKGLEPVKYKVYLVNLTGQSMSSGWTLNVLTNRSQYT